MLDTHAAMWAADDRLKPEVTRTVKAAAARNDLLLSPITAWELGMLVRRGRLALAMSVEEYVRVLFGQPGVVVAALTPSIALSAATLSAKSVTDPADRVLIATAAAYGAQLVTHDRKVHEYAKSTRYLRCIPC
ncbi:MAG TPA: type II toxin-antitoxin system VapC family toxin [Candidatus Nitrosotalea sp.]|nr:type II toxin-antitoxin system VapC family toxin [Candidatus Nitrosotalea sp.]